VYKSSLVTYNKRYVTDISLLLISNIVYLHLTLKRHLMSFKVTSSDLYTSFALSLACSVLWSASTGLVAVAVLAYYAAVLIGRITRLARPSVRPSVCLSVCHVRVRNLKTKRRRKKLVCTFCRAGITGVPVFSSSKVRRTAAYYDGTRPTQ